MKKRLLIPLILLCAVIVSAVLIPIANDITARFTLHRLMRIPLPEKTEFVEKTAIAGKLVGNGNGMQYFGAVLLHSDLTAQELRAYYADYAENEWECLVERQTDPVLGMLDRAVRFQSDISGDGYYVVYSWGKSGCPLSDFDLRGH